MHILKSQTLKTESTFRRWEGTEGRYLVDTYAKIQTDQAIFGHVVEEKGRRLVREGELYDALSNEYSRVGGHPFEICGVQSETEFTVKFRAGYSSHAVTISSYLNEEPEEESDED